MYLPCVGTSDRMCIIEDVFQEDWSWRLKYPECALIIGGDFNTDLEKHNDVSNYIRKFLICHSLVRCDINFRNKQQSTYVNDALGHCSVIDYFVCDVRMVASTVETIRIC